MTHFGQTLVELLRQNRERNVFPKTQFDLAERLGVTASTVNRICNGNIRLVDMGKFQKLIRQFNEKDTRRRLIESWLYDSLGPIVDEDKIAIVNRKGSSKIEDPRLSNETQELLDKVKSHMISNAKFREFMTLWSEMIS